MLDWTRTSSWRKTQCLFARAQHHPRPSPAGLLMPSFSPTKPTTTMCIIKEKRPSPSTEYRRTRTWTAHTDAQGSQKKPLGASKHHPWIADLRSS